MSRLWSRSRVRVHLAASSLAACLVEGYGKSRTVVGKAQFPFDTEGRVAAWRAFHEWMRPVARKAPMEWVLGTADIRYLLLPWTQDLSDPTLRNAFARALLEQKFGLDPDLYEVRFASSSYGHAQLTGFVASALLGEINALADELQGRVAHIEPGLSVVWNRFDALLGSESGALCLIDGDRQLILHHQRTRITNVALRPFSADDPEATTRTQLGETLRVFSSVSTGSALANAGVQLALPESRGFDVERDVAYAFALCGAI